MRFVPWDRRLGVTGLTGRRSFHSPYRGWSLYAGRGAGQHKARHSLGVCQGESQSSPAAHRLAYDSRAFSAGLVYNGAHIFSEIGRAPVTWFAMRYSPATMIERDHPVSGSEVSHLLPPDQGISTRTVRQNYRWSLAMGFVIDISALSVFTIDIVVSSCFSATPTDRQLVPDYN